MGTVDRDIIQEQFAFLTCPDKGNALVIFRCTAGGYPLIEELIDTIKAKGLTDSKKPLQKQMRQQTAISNIQGQHFNPRNYDTEKLIVI